MPGPNVPFPPMEAELVRELPSGDGWQYEPKWDGFRGVLENDGGVAGNKPAAAVDSCFATNGSLIASGNGVWDGILDSKPAGACTQVFPLHSTSRVVAGAPFEGGIFKCALQPVAVAAAKGLYAPWIPSASDVTRLEQIFPQGVCDYTKPDVGRPAGL